MLKDLTDQKHTGRLPPSAHLKAPCQDPPDPPLPLRRSFKMRLTFRRALHACAVLCSCRFTTSTLLKRGSRPERPLGVSPLDGSLRSGQPEGCSILTGAHFTPASRSVLDAQTPCRYQALSQ